MSIEQEKLQRRLVTRLISAANIIADNKRMGTAEYITIPEAKIKEIAIMTDISYDEAYAAITAICLDHNQEIIMTK